MTMRSTTSCRQKIQKNSGFSLVELLVYMGLFSILLVTLMQLFSSILEVNLESQTSSALNQDERYLVARLTHDIHLASTVTIGGGGTTLILVGTGENYTYSIVSGNLTLKDNTTNTTDQLNSTDTTISGLTFTSLWDHVSGHHPSTQIQFTITSKAVRQNGSAQTQQVQTTVATR